MDVKKISMDIPVEDYDWMKENNINMTELFKSSIMTARYQMKQKGSPLLFLVSIMGIVFSVVLIGIGLTPTPVHIFTRGFLCVLGGFLAIVTMNVYIKNKRK